MRRLFSTSRPKSSSGNVLPRLPFLAFRKSATRCKQTHRLGGRRALRVLVLDGLSNQIEHYMDLLSARQRLVASNIANAATPGYKTQDIDFRQEFENELPNSTPVSEDVIGLKTKNDGNNVSIDRESRMLSETALRFSLASQMLRSEIRTLKSAINEGKS